MLLVFFAFQCISITHISIYYTPGCIPPRKPITSNLQFWSKRPDKYNFDP